jgi:broad specificity phosphatase PhoE
MGTSRNHSKDPKIYLIRHGATALNKEGHHGGTDRIRGWQDIPLNSVGREDAKRTQGKLLKERATPEAIFSSDLIRALETAQIINRKFQVPLQATIAFRPWNLGVYQGQESAKVHPDLKHYVMNPQEFVPDGEPFMAFVKRFLPALQKLLEEVKNEKCDLFLVSHYRNFKLADAWVKSGQKPDFSYDPKVLLEDNAAPGEFTTIKPK